MINQLRQEVISENVIKFISELESRNDAVCIAMYSAADARNGYLTEINGLLKAENERLSNKIEVVSKIMTDIKEKDKAFKLLYKDFFKDFIPNWDASASSSLYHAKVKAEKWAVKEFGDGYKKDLRRSPAISRYIMRVLREYSKGKWVLENKNNSFIWRKLEKVLGEWVKLMIFKGSVIDLDNI